MRFTACMLRLFPKKRGKATVTSSRASRGGASCALRSLEKGWAGGRGHRRSVGGGSRQRAGGPRADGRRAAMVSTTYHESATHRAGRPASPFCAVTHAVLTQAQEECPMLRVPAPPGGGHAAPSLSLHSALATGRGESGLGATPPPRGSPVPNCQPRALSPPGSRVSPFTSP